MLEEASEEGNKVLWCGRWVQKCGLLLYLNFCCDSSRKELHEKAVNLFLNNYGSGSILIVKLFERLDTFTEWSQLGFVFYVQSYFRFCIDVSFSCSALHYRLPRPRSEKFQGGFRSKNDNYENAHRGACAIQVDKAGVKLLSSVEAHDVCLK